MIDRKKISRAELYNLVWSRSINDLSEVLAVSASSIRRACSKYDIPIPERRSRKAIHEGKLSPRTPLPARSPGMAEDFILGVPDYDKHSRWLHEPSAPLPPTPRFKSSIGEVRAAVATKIGRVAIRGGKHEWHLVIQQLFRADDKRRNKLSVNRHAFYWNKPRFDNAFEQRRLAILNALLISVAKCGGRPAIKGDEAVDIIVTFHQQSVPVKLMATSDVGRQKRFRPPDESLPATAPLTLLVPNNHGGAEARAIWADSEEEKLEEKLTDIAIELVVLSEILYRENVERHREWLLKQKAYHQQRLAAEAAASAERLVRRDDRFGAARREMLIQHARDFADARALRQFAKEILELKGATAGPQVVAWADLVRSEAERLDPLHNERFLDVMALQPEMFDKDAG